MATETFYFSGTCKWAKVYKPDMKFEPQYTIDLYMDDESWDSYADSGLRLKKKEDEDGEYVGFRRKVAGPEWKPDMGPPTVIDAKGNEFKELIGNGSKVTIKVDVYDTKMGKGHRLETVRVDEHVKYEAPKEEPEVEDEPKKETKSKPKTKGLPF